MQKRLETFVKVQISAGLDREGVEDVWFRKLREQFRQPARQGSSKDTQKESIKHAHNLKPIHLRLRTASFSLLPAPSDGW